MSLFCLLIVIFYRMNHWKEPEAYSEGGAMGAKPPPMDQ